MSMKIKEAIKHYQRALDRSKDEDRTIHCISKLCRLPVTVQHLKETGIGKTVNALRKYEGKIGETAKVLVQKWKDMVVAEYSSDEEQEQKGDISISLDVSEISQDSISKDKDEEKNQSSSALNYHKSRVSDHKSDRVSDHKSDRVSDHKSDRVSDHKSDRVSDHKSDNFKSKHKHDKKRNENSSKKDKYKEKKSKNHSNDDELHTIKNKEKEKSHKKKEHKSHSHSSEESKKSKNNYSSQKNKYTDEESTNNYTLDKEKNVRSESYYKEKNSKSKVEFDKNNLEQEEDSIDCNSGASFAEALMASYHPPKKTNASTSNSTMKRKTTENVTLAFKKPKPNPQSSLTLTSGDFELDSKNSYINEPFVINTIASKSTTMTEEEALNQLMITKNQRTKVYSGVKSNKSWSSIPTLFDCCIRILQENIDAIDYTGGIPYSIIKPVLMHASATQLFTLEQYNPYLIEDTNNELWEYHVKKDFRNKDKLSNETYREMYLRCLEEREIKLKTIASNISQNIARSAPVRQTKLTYVNSHVKPPRNVARQQAKYGTSAVTKVPTKGAVKPNITPRILPMPRVTSTKTKPKMAPLMQKTMKLAKSFKR